MLNFHVNSLNNEFCFTRFNPDAPWMQDFTDSSNLNLGLEYEENKYSVTTEKKKFSFILIFVVTHSSVIYFICCGI